MQVRVGIIYLKLGSKPGKKACHFWKNNVLKYYKEKFHIYMSVSCCRVHFELGQGTGQENKDMLCLPFTLPIAMFSK